MPVRLADPANPLFKDLHRVLDKQYCDLHVQGIGATQRQAEVVTSIEEERLWECSPLTPLLVYCELCSIIMGLILFSAVANVV